MPAFGDTTNVASYMDALYVYLRARAHAAVGRARPAKHENKSEVYAKARRIPAWAIAEGEPRDEDGVRWQSPCRQSNRFEIVEIDLDGPKSGEVLVEIKATGICHTDAYTLDGFDSEGIFPSVLGHEGAGIVREIGAGVTSVKPGLIM